MAGIPQWLYIQTGQDIVIEPYVGAGPFGDTYGPATVVRCIVDERRRLVRDATGDTVVSETTVYCPLTVAAPPGSRVTLPDGRVSVVLTSSRGDGGRLPVPSHLEVAVR
ncbi:hypothetical protein LX15_004802 [Streptoalloteichus tenebrarius]|uniref:Head-to-tail stopper n=1 Tax=Streptoalloteichus tenebrarius (strain ATCC 17920 / DSM 40477 / JCM 4838 / CBS 697.72 / NBRC 16177 / NCIMB 11028 / NRRL B-12390 / A12253. 1 / ISP 5477) TaxID=1933 RepID=A0ABT1HZW9_STRSD|nr:hypothetical protein [Streptoalloteichus tenebrarius]BFF03123.1 hypothetical protein GCM10020241_47980 [Streptoalloteichus tenebrarius]